MRLRTRNESRETRAERIVIMPTTVSRWLENLQLFSAFRCFEQPQPEARLIPSPWLALRINSDSCLERSLRTRADIVRANHRRVRKYVEEFRGAEMDATHLQHSAGSN